MSIPTIAIFLTTVSVAVALAIILLAWKLHQKGKKDGRASILYEQIENSEKKLKALSRSLPSRSDMLKWMRRRMPNAK